MQPLTEVINRLWRRAHMSEREIIEVEPEARPADPLAMIDRAVKAGYRGEELRCLFDLWRQWSADQARQKFADALTAFQRECPQVERRKNVENKYKYAPYEEVMGVAGPIMIRHGIVATFTTEETADGIKATCNVRVGTHCEPTTVTIKTPAGNKLVNAAQLSGQTLSYAKRYAICAALNIVCRSEDSDMNYVSQSGLTPQHVVEINKALDAFAHGGKGEPAKLLAEILKVYQVESLDEIPDANHRDILALLRERWKGVK